MVILHYLNYHSIKYITSMNNYNDIKPESNKDLIITDSNGNTHYCFLSKHGEFKCSLTGFTLLTDCITWKYDEDIKQDQ